MEAQMWNVFLVIQLATAVGGPANQPQIPSAVTSGCPDRTLYSMVRVRGLLLAPYREKAREEHGFASVDPMRVRLLSAEADGRTCDRLRKLAEPSAPGQAKRLPPMRLTFYEGSGFYFIVASPAAAGAELPTPADEAEGWIMVVDRNWKVIYRTAG